MFFCEITDCSSASTGCEKCGVNDNVCTECAVGYVLDGSGGCKGEKSTPIIASFILTC